MSSAYDEFIPEPQNLGSAESPEKKSQVDSLERNLQLPDFILASLFRSNKPLQQRAVRGVCVFVCGDVGLNV